MMIKLQNVSFFLLLLFIISSVVQIPYVFGRIYMMEIIIFIMFGVFLYRKRIPKFDSVQILIIFFGFITSLISSMFSDEIYIFTWGFYFLSILLVFNLAKTLDEKNIIYIMVVFLLFHHIFQTIGLFIGVDNFGFGKQGLFSNPNNFGLFSAYSFFISCCLVKLSNFLKFSIFSLFYSFVLVLLSVSRLCLILTVFSIFSFFIYYFFMEKWYKKIYSYVLIILSLIIFFFIYKYGFFDSILEKNNAVDNIGDVSNGRFDLWEKAINSINIWGNGSQYYKYEEHTTHNNYLHVAVVYGFLILISFILFYGYCLLSTFYILVKRKDFIAFIAFISLVLLLLFWCFEVGSSLFIVWFTLLIIGFSRKNIYS